MSLLLLLVILIPGLGSNLENLKIVDSLLRQYDRRATPTTNTGAHTNPIKENFLFLQYFDSALQI